MPPYTHQKLSRLRLLAMALRALISILKFWPLWLAVMIYCAPITPLLRWHYTYRDAYGVRIFVSCEYLGFHGKQPYMRGGDCPFVIWQPK